MAILQVGQNQQVLPLASYPNGTRVLPLSGSVDIADNVREVYFDILCNSSVNPSVWPNVTTVLQSFPEISLDGGATWDGAGGSITPGGPHLGKHGEELLSVQSTASLPPAVNGITRKMRWTMTVTGGPLLASADIHVI